MVLQATRRSPLRSAAAVLPLLAALAFHAPTGARATTYNGNPSNYWTLLGGLVAGDTLKLAAGNYVRLTFDGLQGTPSAGIVVTGPESGAPAVVQAEYLYNTIQFYGCAYLTLRKVTVDGLWLDMDGINAGGTSSHHIVVEDCVLTKLGTDQQTVGISTKTAVWNWTVRRNVVQDVGTGMYFGDSDGGDPFIAGIIDGNLVRNPVGYCMQIKHQNNYSLAPGMPAGPSRTIIRNNVFIKDDRSSPEGDRPNLLVDGFPDSGPGSTDLYEIYGNFIAHNPRESLMQISGRAVIHDNILLDAGADQTAIYFIDHNRPVKLAHVYNNTIYGGMQGIRFANTPREEGRVVGNMVFAGTPISSCCTLAANTGNVTDTIANAGNYLNQPSFTLGSVDLYPRSSCSPCQGAALDLSTFSTNTDYDRDFNAASKGSFAFRGAYAGAGTNPGWALANGLKSGGSTGGGGDVVPPAAITDLGTR